MKIYLVIEDYGQEGPRVRGAYQSLKDAEAAALLLVTEHVGDAINIDELECDRHDYGTQVWTSDGLPRADYEKFRAEGRKKKAERLVGKLG